MKAEISMPRMMRRVTIEAKVIGVRRTKFRIWLGCKIIILAAAVMGCNVEVEMRP